MKRKPPQLIPRGRLYTVVAGLGLLAAGLLARAVELQVLRTDFLKDEGSRRYLREVAIPAHRGSITDRHGRPLAVSTPVSSVWGNPQELVDNGKALQRLASVLDRDPTELGERLRERAERGAQFVWLRRHVKPGRAQRVEALALDGVGLRGEYRRYYPAAEVTSHVVGFTNIDDRGQEGLELAYDDWLSGRPGAKRVIKDRLGRIVEDVELVRKPEPGRSLALTIDRRLQYVAYRALKRAVLERGADSGSVVVLDVPTGEVLALVNQPAYNPNQRPRVAGEQLRNRALTDVFEPGSVIKPYTVVAALESGRFDIDTSVDTGSGRFEVADHTVRDWDQLGVIDVAEVVVKSSNVGATKLALALEPAHLWDVLKRFGFGTVTGSGFPGESPGSLPHHSRWSKVRRATLSYGYGLSVTPLQLAVAYAALANDGRLRAPSFVRGEPNPAHAVIDPRLAQRMRGILDRVVSAEGTGSRAEVAHYSIAGKTGTSRKAGRHGYQDRYVASFAGMAPVDDPKVVVVVVIDDPAGEAYYGGQVAAPVFAEVMGDALRLRGVPPQAPEVRHVDAGHSAADRAAGGEDAT